VPLKCQRLFNSTPFCPLTKQMVVIIFVESVAEDGYILLCIRIIWEPLFWGVYENACLFVSLCNETAACWTCLRLQRWCGPRRRTEKALRCFRSNCRIFSSSVSGSSGLLYSSSSTSFSEPSPALSTREGCVELGSVALFFRHLVRRFWNHTWEESHYRVRYTQVLLKLVTNK